VDASDGDAGVVEGEGVLGEETAEDDGIGGGTDLDEEVGAVPVQVRRGRMKSRMDWTKG
jgi:hypothetical protein